jgi:hypothetical protein
MHRRTTLQHTLVAGLAAAALAASPALARPVDRVDRFGPVTSQPHQYQDLRGEEAKDAAHAAEQEHFRPGQPTWPTHPAPAPKPVKAVPAHSTTSSGDDDIWLLLGIGIAATGIVAGGAVGVSRRYRVRARRAIA